MATDKPRFTITVDPETLDRINAYKEAEKLSTQSKAILALVRLGLARLEDGDVLSSVTGDAARAAEDYGRLDRYGRAAVRAVLDAERQRLEEQEALAALDPDRDRKVINLYVEPSAAGIAAPVAGTDYEPYELREDDPVGAAYAVRIQGDSMEPWFPDGSVAFVNHDALRDGDIGIFCVDGGTVCKQYHYDPVLGMTYLFSLNRKREDADVILTRSSGQTLVCQGRVMTTRRFRLPGDE